MPEDRIIDQCYADLMADGVAAVRSIYERWEIPFGGRKGRLRYTDHPVYFGVPSEV